MSDYLSWAGAATVTAPQPGDLCIFGPDVHIGIAISSTQMISALNSQLGTQTSGIAGTASGELSYRRLTGVPAVATTAAAASNMNSATVASLLLVGGTLAAASLVVLIGVAGAVWLTTRLIRRPADAS